jgi:F-type H+-transporting ATPase subunit epsilon
VAELLTLEIATPTGLALSTECESVAAPSVNGEFGVLPGHLPLLATLKAGVIHYSVEGKMQMAAVGPGFVEAAPDKVLLLTDAFARPEDVDVDGVREELTGANTRLDALEEAHVGVAYEQIQREIDWALARLAIVGKDE